jgi:hypothetical protein
VVTALSQGNEEQDGDIGEIGDGRACSVFLMEQVSFLCYGHYGFKIDLKHTWTQAFSCAMAPFFETGIRDYDKCREIATLVQKNPNPSPSKHRLGIHMCGPSTRINMA